jgi:endonuclease/exonuclease/phosphatase family metal-dependent hydrolase
VTLNVKFGERVDIAVDELLENEELCDADIILLQEMDGAGVERIARQLQYNYIYCPASVHKKHNKDFGNAILSIWPVKSAAKIILPYQHTLSGQRRNAVFATIEVTKFEIIAGSVHTETPWLSLDRRIAQADSIVKSIPSDAKYVLVGGDFNTSTQFSVTETEKVFARLGMIRASKGVGATATFPPFDKPQFELDHIFSRGMQVVKHGKLQSSSVSDHLPVWVTLRLEDFE